MIIEGSAPACCVASAATAQWSGAVAGDAIQRSISVRVSDRIDENRYKSDQQKCRDNRFSWIYLTHDVNQADSPEGRPACLD